MAVKAAGIVAAARQVIGAHYTWWQDGDPIPAWYYDYSGAPPASYVFDRGIMCLTGDTMVVASGIERSYKRVHDGEVVTIETVGGKKLTATPNHPVLSKRGWVPIHGLKKGDYVLGGQRFGESSALEPDDYRQPTPLHDIHDAAASEGALERIETVFDFHGDRGQGKVDVVHPRRFLGNGVEPGFSEHGFKLGFPKALAGQGRLVELGSPDSGGLVVRPATPNYLVGGPRLPLAVLDRSVPVAEPGGFGRASADAALLEPGGDSPLRNPRIRSDPPFGLSSEVTPDYLIGVDGKAATLPPRLALRRSEPGGLLDGPDLDAFLPEDSPNAFLGDAETSGDLSGGLPFDVPADKVVSVKRHAFRGNVYNLQTESGRYMANGVITHNCSDFINYARQECGLSFIGGTPAYYDWIQANSGVSFDPSTPGVPGALCVNPGVWRGGIGQGHIALYTDEHTLIQSDSSRGVNEGEQDYVSHGWVEGGYWLYGLMPDVDYSDESADPTPTAPELPTWFGVGADGVVRLGGDWSQGWIRRDEDGQLRYVAEYQGG